MTTAINRVQKLVTFSPQLYYNAETKAKYLGVPFAEYLRHLIIKDVEEDIVDIPMVDDETNKRIGESLEAYKRGEYTELKTEKDIEDFVHGLHSNV